MKATRFNVHFSLTPYKFTQIPSAFQVCSIYLNGAASTTFNVYAYCIQYFYLPIPFFFSAVVVDDDDVAVAVVTFFVVQRTFIFIV